MNISGIKSKTHVVLQNSKQQFKETCDNDRLELNNNLPGLNNELKLYKNMTDKIKSSQVEDMPLLNDMPSPWELKETVGKAISSETINPPDSDIVLKFKELFDKNMVKPGDIILISMRTNISIHPLANILPGKYTHVAVYLGKNEKGEHQSIDAKAHERTPIRTVDWWPENYNNWCVISPHHADGTELTDEERQKVVNFAKTAEGCKYNYNWIDNKVKLPVKNDKTRFYCSQLAWASYNFTLGINLDPTPGFSIKYAWGVAPQELRDSPLVDVIGEYRTTDKKTVNKN